MILKLVQSDRFVSEVVQKLLEALIFIVRYQRILQIVGSDDGFEGYTL